MPNPAWVGHVRHYLGTITKSDATIYDPPIRVLEITADGNVALVLDGDDESDAGAVYVKAVKAGDFLTYFAIRQVRSTSTTATIGGGFT